MTKELVIDSNHIYKKPEFLAKLASRGDLSMQIGKLASKIKALKADECIVYTIDEFTNIFGGSKNIKTKLQSTRAVLKNQWKVKKPRIIMDQDRIYIFETKV